MTVPVISYIVEVIFGFNPISSRKSRAGFRDGFFPVTKRVSQMLPPPLVLPPTLQVLTHLAEPGQGFAGCLVSQPPNAAGWETALRSPLCAGLLLHFRRFQPTNSSPLLLLLVLQHPAAWDGPPVTCCRHVPVNKKGHFVRCLAQTQYFLPVFFKHGHFTTYQKENHSLTGLTPPSSSTEDCLVLRVPEACMRPETFALVEIKRLSFCSENNRIHCM